MSPTPLTDTVRYPTPFGRGCSVVGKVGLTTPYFEQLTARASLTDIPHLSSQNQIISEGVRNVGKVLFDILIGVSPEIFEGLSGIIEVIRSSTRLAKH